MKKIRSISILLFCLLPGVVLFAQSQAPEPAVKTGFAGAYSSLPVFPGCDADSDESTRLRCFQNGVRDVIMKNVQYPPMAREQGISGVVYVRIMIGTQGEVKEVQSVQGRTYNKELEAEAVRVLKKLPALTKPATLDGEPVHVQFIQPVRFVLQ